MAVELVDGLNEATNEEYHSDRKYLSSSVLKTLYKSLDDYRKQYIEGEKKVFGNQSALDMGTLLHTALLEPHLFENSYNVYPGMRRAGAEYEKFMAALTPEQATKPVLLLSHAHTLKKLIAEFRKHEVASELLKNTISEQTICGTLNGVKVKARFDAISVERGEIYDVKSTGYGGDVESFTQTMKDLMYPLSGALYCAIAEAHYGKPFTFYYLVGSKKDLDWNVYRTSEKTAALGMRQVQQACSKYLRAVESGVWTELQADMPEKSANSIILEV